LELCTNSVRRVAPILMSASDSKFIVSSNKRPFDWTAIRNMILSFYNLKKRLQRYAIPPIYAKKSPFLLSDVTKTGPIGYKYASFSIGIHGICELPSWDKVVEIKVMSFCR
jgi:hypothetical protein